jgi:hypothetical protein
MRDRKKQPELLDHASTCEACAALLALRTKDRLYERAGEVTLICRSVRTGRD